MKKLKNYIQPEIQFIDMVDVIMTSGLIGGGDVGDGGYAGDNFN